MRIITIGNATLDISLKSPEFKTQNSAGALCFSPGSKLYINDAHFNLGGGAINSSFTFAKLGFEVNAYFKVGKDFIGKIIIDKLTKDRFGKIKIYPRFVQENSSFSAILLPENEDRIILAYHSKNYHKWELKDFPQNIKNSFVFINTDETLVNTWKTYLSQLKNSGNFVAINPSKPFLQESKNDVVEILNLADIVILNKTETEMFLGEENEPEKAMSNLKNILPNPKIIVMTMDKKGVILMQDKNIYYSPGFKVEKIVDGTGAGDAFGSAFCGYLIKHGFTRILSTDSHGLKHESAQIGTDDIIKEAIRRGCANAVSVIEYVSAQAGILTEEQYNLSRFQNFEIILNNLI